MVGYLWTFEFENILQCYNLGVRCQKEMSGTIYLLAVNKIYFTLIVYLMYCDCKCSVTLPRDTIGWSAVFDRDVSR